MKESNENQTRTGSEFLITYCPQCGESTETLNEGCCEECRCQNQRRLNAHNISFDRWESLSDQEREQEIKLATVPCSFGT